MSVRFAIGYLVITLLLIADSFYLILLTALPICHLYTSWLVRDTVRFVRCPHCGSAILRGGSALKLVYACPYSSNRESGGLVSRREGRLVACRVCQVVMFAGLEPKWVNQTSEVGMTDFDGYVMGFDALEANKAAEVLANQRTYSCIWMGYYAMHLTCLILAAVPFAMAYHYTLPAFWTAVLIAAVIYPWLSWITLRPKTAASQ
jgi:hypothetical protein